jgi:AmiR/NasT family two-component response regulator
MALNMNLGLGNHPHSSLLLVDDESITLANLEKDLNQAGYSVIAVESVDEAETALMAGLHPDLVILDVRMPNRNGFELTETLNSMDHIPFILLTAYNDLEIVEQAKSLGALCYLVKPIDVQQLIPSIELAISRARELRSLKETGLQLQNALNKERSISTAIGIIMVQHKLNRKDAFEFLRKAARDQRKKLNLKTLATM